MTQQSEKILSLIVGGRNDGYMGDFKWRLGTCLNYLANSLDAIDRLNDIEVIVCDWGSEKPLHEELQLSPDAISITRFVIVPPEIALDVQKDSPFPIPIVQNVAIRRCKGEFIAQTDSDIIFTSLALERLLGILEGSIETGINPRKALMTSSRKHIPQEIVFAEPSLEQMQEYLDQYGSMLPYDKLIPGIGTPSGLAMMHRDIWHACGGYDEKLIYWGWMEIDLYLRITAEYPWRDLANYGFDLYHIEHYSGEDRMRQPRKANPMLTPHEFRANDEHWGKADKDFAILSGEELKAEQDSEKPVNNKTGRLKSLLDKSIETGLCATGVQKLVLNVLKRTHQSPVGKRLKLEPEITGREDKLNRGVKSDWDYKDAIAWYIKELHPMKYLEIGIRDGHASSLASGLFRPLAIYGFDGWDNTEEAHLLPGPTWLADLFRDLGHSGYVRHIIGETVDKLSDFFANPDNPSTFDLMIIGGNDSLESTIKKYHILKKHLSSNGLLILKHESDFIFSQLKQILLHDDNDLKTLAGKTALLVFNQGKNSDNDKQETHVRESELDFVIPPEIKDDELYHLIEHLSKQEEVHSILEIGSSSGEGSTEAFVKGMKTNPGSPVIYCMELSKPRYSALTKRYQKYDFVKPYNVSSVSVDKFPAESDVSEFYNSTKSALNDYPLDRVLGWLKQDIEYLKNSGAQANGIQKIKDENGIILFDLVLIDGSEFTGSAELDEVYGAKYILLDDVNGFKNRRNYDRLKSDTNYSLVKENWKLRAGYALFRRNEEILTVHFFTIVLNGEPFIRHHIEQLKKLPFKWRWHIVEGVASLRHDTAWSLENGGRVTDEIHRNGISNDGTSEYIDQLAEEYPENIRIYRKPDGLPWNGKLEMVNTPLVDISEECLLWQIDVDEFWTAEQLIRMRDLFVANPTKTSAYYYCHYFVGQNLLTTTKDTYGNNSSYEWLRTWRFKPGMKWDSHEPPRLVEFGSEGAHVDVGSTNPFVHTETEKYGLLFHHLAYVLEKQLRFKEIYYGYKNAVAGWRQLQEADKFPVKLKDYFPWVEDETEVNTADSNGITLHPVLSEIRVSPKIRKKSKPKKILVVSHERSGTHFLINSIAKNFPVYSNEELSFADDPDKLYKHFKDYFGEFESRIFKSHHQFYFFENFIDALLENFHIFYIVRDGRDVITSCFHYYNSVPNEFPKTKSIGELLHAPADAGYCIDRSSNIAERWAKHVDSWLQIENRINIIKYEDLLGDFNSVIDTISRSIGLEPDNKIYKPTLHDRTVSPRKGIAGDWRNHFTDEDSNFFHAYASDQMQKLGYNIETAETELLRKIIWFRPDSIGDAVLAASMLPVIHTRYKGTKITAVCRDHLREFYAGCPFIDEIFTLNWEKLIEDAGYRRKLEAEFKSLKADILLNSVYSRETYTDSLAVESDAEVKIAQAGDLSNIKLDLRQRNNSLYTKLIESDGSYKPEIERHKDFLNGIGIESAQLLPQIWTAPKDERFAEDLFRLQKLDSHKTIALFAGAQYDVRVYEHYGKALNQVCRDGKYRIIALGSAKEWKINQRNLNAIGAQNINLSGKTTITQSAAILRRCRLAVGAETGLAHMACALGIPNVILLGGGHFGRFMPYSSLTTVACLPLECYACNWECKFGRAHCIKDISPEVISEAVKAALDNPSHKIRIFYQNADSWRNASDLPKWSDFDRFMHSGNYSKHEVSVNTKPIEITPKSTEKIKIEASSYNQAGEEFYEKGDVSKALFAFREAIKIDPDYAEAHNNLGVLYFSLNEIDKSIDSLSKAYEINPSDRDTILNYTEILIALGRKDEAAAICEKYLAENPDDREFIDLMKEISSGKTIPDSEESLKFSVITASYNQGQYIAKCIESVSAQEYDNFEHIVIDGGSTDNTPEILTKYPHLNWVSESDKGQADAINKGFRKADGDIIAWLNSDDYYEPEVFKTVAEFFRQNPEEYVVMGNCSLVRENGEIFDTVINHERGFNQMKQYWVGRSIPTQPAIFFRRELLDKHGLLDEKLHLAMDYDLWMRFAQDYRFRHIDKTFANYLFHSESKSGDNDWSKFEPEWQIVHRRYIMNQGDPPSISVIIPCYNYASFLPEAVGSVLKQTYHDYEIIIVNDGSSDNTAEVAKILITENPNARIRLLDQKNAGHPAYSRNNGIEIAFGEYIVCLDADDLIASNYLKECVKILEDDVKIGAVYPDQIHFENGSEKYIESQEWNDIAALYNNPMPTCSMYRKSAWKEAGGYKPIGYEDWDLWITIGGDLGYTVKRIPKPLFRYRINHDGVFAGHQEKDKENKARIILNHPNLYGEESVEIAKNFLARRGIPVN